MKKRTITLLWSAIICAGINAQDFPSTDENGQTVYYKILSAFPEYAELGLCIQDNTTSKIGYGYVLAPADATKKSQEWALIADDKGNGTYNLRCRSSYRFISTSSNWNDDWLVQSYATKKQESDGFIVQAIGENQVSISYEGEYGRYYLCASDINKSKTKLPGILRNTIWAWKILPSSELENGLEGIDNEKEDCQTYDLQGRMLPCDQPLNSGIYIRKTATRTYKIHIR